MSETFDDDHNSVFLAENSLYQREITKDEAKNIWDVRGNTVDRVQSTKEQIGWNIKDYMRDNLNVYLRIHWSVTCDQNYSKFHHIKTGMFFHQKAKRESANWND